MDWKESRWKRTWSNSRQHRRNCLENLREATKYLSGDTWSPCRYPNPKIFLLFFFGVLDDGVSTIDYMVLNDMTGKSFEKHAEGSRPNIPTFF
jgi:hypothetical protein